MTPLTVTLTLGLGTIIVLQALRIHWLIDRCRHWSSAALFQLLENDALVAELKIAGDEIHRLMADDDDKQLGQAS